MPRPKDQQSRAEIPKLHVRADVALDTINEKDRTVELVWTTGAKGLRSPWFGEPYYEQLSLEPTCVRMQRMESGNCPLQAVHNTDDLDDVIGVIERGWLASSTEGRAKVRFAEDEISDRAWQKVKSKILRNVSVGYNVYRYERQPLAEGETIPTYLAVDWEPMEVTIVPVGFDSGAAFRSRAQGAEDKHECVLQNPVSQQRNEEGERTMPPEITKPAETTPTPTPAPAPAAAATSEAAATEARKGEKLRQEQIRTVCTKMGLDEVFVKRMIDEDKTIDQVRELVIDEKVNQQAAQQIRAANPVVTVGETDGEKWRSGASQWLMQRSGVSVAEAVEKSQGGKKLEPGEFRGMTMLDLARESLERNGVKTRGIDKMRLVGMALTHTRSSGGFQSTSDFAVLLENALHKVLLASYGITQDTWSRICAKGTVSDFRAHPRYRMGTFGSLDKVLEGGEYKNKAIPDGAKESLTAVTKGNIIALSRQSIINDDMGIFNSLAMRFGRAAKLSVEVDFYALLALNSNLGPTMNDGLSLFHATHTNISTGAAISAAAFDADRVAMASQKDPSANEILDLKPAILLIPVGLGGQARVINGSLYDPDTVANKAQMKPNVVNGLFRDVVDTARITGTRRYLFADPSIAPVIEVAFLDGQAEPFLETKEGFRVDGVEWKVRLDYACGGVDFRGAVTNAGV